LLPEETAMALPREKEPPFSADAYLAWEALQVEKHEYINGEVFAMVGARLVHSVAASNLLVALRRELKPSPCRVFQENAKTRVAEANAYFYPDVVVTCDPRDRLTPQFISHPALIIEILSDSTAAFDRGEKFAHYRKLDSLMEYGIVDLKAKRVEVFRRNAENHWVLYEYFPGGQVEFPSLAISISVDEIFDDTEEPPEPPENE